METIYNPSENYHTYKEEFRKNAETLFDELTQRSGVNKAANQKLCQAINVLNLKRNTQSSKQNTLAVWRFILWVLGFGGLALGFYFAFNIHKLDNFGQQVLFSIGDADFNLINAGILLVSFIFLYLAFGPLTKNIREMEKAIQKLDTEIKEKKDVAYQQMQCLNQLFGDDIPLKLIEKTVPKLEFDPYCTRDRLSELRDDFGYVDNSDSYSSVVCTQSGQINGNPFVFVRKKIFHWGNKTYEGHKTIYWTEYVKDSQGHSHAVTRSQTLTATYTAPYPYFNSKTYVIYGNEAAPNLSFDREASDLATSDGIWAKMKYNSKVKELKEFSQDLTDDSDYTMMNNEKFEVYFETKNRDNEVEFRLLFTPLAQVQMLELLKNKIDGFGGDFAFRKRKKLNFIYPKHLQDTPLEISASTFCNYDYDQCKANFLTWNLEYFRAIYFAMAPLLCIPLYQQYRTRKTIYSSSKRQSNQWEWEMLSNRLGKVFDHINCVTDHILKTRLVKDLDNGKAQVQVTSHGFSGTNHTYYESVWGGDGRMHSVPVEWVEYREVTQNTNVTMCDKEGETTYATDADKFMDKHHCWIER